MFALFLVKRLAWYFNNNEIDVLLMKLIIIWQHSETFLYI